MGSIIILQHPSYAAYENGEKLTYLLLYGVCDHSFQALKC